MAAAGGPSIVTEYTDEAIDRRTLLRTVGATGAAATLAGCSLFGGGSSGTPTSSSSPEPRDRNQDDEELSPTGEEIPHAEEYRTVVDLGRAGADPTGEEDIIPLLEAHAGDDTLLYLPEGRYLMGDDWLLKGFEKFALVGPEATIQPPDGYRRTMFLFTEGSGLLIEGLTFDFTADDTGARPLNARIDDGLVVRDVTVRGQQDVDHDMMRFDVTDSDGTGLIERMRLPDGAVRALPVTGCLVTGDSVGTLTFRDCEIAGFPDNGLYASAADGPVTVDGGYYANNAIANVRVGDGAVVRGVHVKADISEQADNTRGIRLREGTSALVENCTVELLEVPTSDGAITVATQMREVEIRDTTIRIDADGVAAVLAKSPIDEHEEDPDVKTAVRLQNVEITGSAAREAAVTVVDREDSRFQGLCITQTGDSRDGIRLLRSNGARIADCGIDVTGEPVVLRKSTAATSGLRDTCDPDTRTATTARQFE